MGRGVRRKQALDFLAVTDHAEYLGIAPAIAEFIAPELISDNWQRVMAAAERYYQPEQVTTFVVPATIQGFLLALTISDCKLWQSRYLLQSSRLSVAAEDVDS
jgi:hypothetical protein